MAPRLLPVLLAAALAAPLPAAPPPPVPPRTSVPAEREEAAPRPPDRLKKVETDDEAGDQAVALGAYYARLPDVARAAAETKYPGAKAFLLPFAVAHDRLVEVAGTGTKTTRITPVPLRWGLDKYPDEFGVVPLDDKDRPLAVRALNPDRRQVRRVEPFEQLALEEVDRFLRPPVANAPDPGPVPDRLTAAERVLSSVLLFHDRAREADRRKGRSWDPLKADLDRRLLEVRMTRLRQAVAARDWAAVRDLGPRLAERYRTDPKVLETVYAARLAEAEQALKADRDADFRRARDLLNEYDARFPGSADAAAGRVRKTLSERAGKAVEEAKRKLFTDPRESARLLSSAESLDPDLPGLRESQRELRGGYSVLVVGAKQVPVLMSPATARFPSERQAVELMFEGLLEPVPDPDLGVRYLPALAADKRSGVPGERDLALVGNAPWAGADAGAFDPADLAGTVTLLRARAHAWDGEAVEWLEDPAADPADPNRVRVRFRRWPPDPRTLLTFKMLPARWLRAKNQRADDPAFARRPVGTGPFRLLPAAPSDKSRDVVFVANPGYGRRPGRLAQPAIKEVRFAPLAAIPDPVAAFRDGRLHVLTDVPTADLSRYTANNNQDGKVGVHTAAFSRRIHLLAVNHRRPALQSVDLRRGLLHAINREQILTEVFRAGAERFHRPLAGPFPPGTWAAPVDPAPLFSQDVAGARFQAYKQGRGSGTLGLLYPADDPQAKAACERIKAQVEAAGGGLQLAPEGVEPRELVRRVEDEFRYDLAYVPFDYPDDWYPLALAALLDPAAAGAGGRNWFGYAAAGAGRGPEDEPLDQALADARARRDPAKLGLLARTIHRRFNETVPFVPLWHLDRHMVIATAVKVVLDGGGGSGTAERLPDPVTLFGSVGRWRME